MTKTSYKTGSYTIPAQGEIGVNRVADFLTCLSASHKFRVRFDNGTESDFEAGLTLHDPDGFTRVEIRNPSDDPLIIHMGFGLGDIRDSRLTLTGTINTQEVAANVFAAHPPLSVAAGAVELVSDRNAARSEIGITNRGANEIWLRGDAVAAVAGQPVAPGQGVVLSVAAAVYAYNPGAGSVEVAYWEAGE